MLVPKVVHLNVLGGPQSNPARGVVCVGGDGTNALDAETPSTGSKYMWLKMYPDNSVQPMPTPILSNGGVIPAFIKFTFSYELGAYGPT